MIMLMNSIDCVFLVPKFVIIFTVSLKTLDKSNNYHLVIKRKQFVNALKYSIENSFFDRIWNIQSFKWRFLQNWISIIIFSCSNTKKLIQPLKWCNLENLNLYVTSFSSSGKFWNRFGIKIKFSRTLVFSKLQTFYQLNRPFKSHSV